MKVERYLESLLQLATGDGLDMYAVGGSIRDCLLGRECKDCDFTAHGILKIAQKFASQNKLPLVLLDKTQGRETARVVIQKQIYFDFTEMQGQNLEEDLARRDFTINAMALPLPDFPKGISQLIDPTQGQADLENHIIRMVSPEVLSDDPLRMLRAFRFAGNLNFEIEPATLAEITGQKEKISNVAAERVLYELNLLLSSESVFPCLESMAECGLLNSILPETADITAGRKGWDKTLEVLKNFERLLLSPDKVLSKHASLGKRSLLDNRSLARLAILLHPLDDPATQGEGAKSPRKACGQPKAVAVLKRLRASNAEIAFIARALQSQKRALQTELDFTEVGKDESRLYHYVRESGTGLIPALFMACSARPGLESAAQRVSDFYFQRYLPALQKESLLTGDDLIKNFNLSPGPSIQSILDRVQEARVLGKISTRAEAEKMASSIIDSK